MDELVFAIEEQAMDTYFAHQDKTQLKDRIKNLDAELAYWKALADRQPECGHPYACVESDADEGGAASWCEWCASEAALQSKVDSMKDELTSLRNAALDVHAAEIKNTRLITALQEIVHTLGANGHWQTNALIAKRYAEKALQEAGA